MKRARLRTMIRADGVLAYEVLDASGKVKGRSRNFRRVWNHFLANRKAA
jgi:hypothetical protein